MFGETADMIDDVARFGTLTVDLGQRSPEHGWIEIVVGQGPA